MKEACWYWHSGAGQLMGICWDYGDKIKELKGDEQGITEGDKILSRLFQPIKGPLPIEMVAVGESVIEAHEICSQAGKDYEEALGRYNPLYWAYTEWEARNKARRDYIKTWKANEAAKQALYKRCREASKIATRYRVAIEALHRQECPNCPLG